MSLMLHPCLLPTPMPRFPSLPIAFCFLTFYTMFVKLSLSSFIPNLFHTAGWRSAKLFGVIFLIYGLKFNIPYITLNSFDFLSTSLHCVRRDGSSPWRAAVGVARGEAELCGLRRFFDCLIGLSEKEEEGEMDSKVLQSFHKSFVQVQNILDQNRLLINEINLNHESMIPDNLSRNVSLIRELNNNIRRVVGLYADLSISFAKPMVASSGGDSIRTLRADAKGFLKRVQSG